MKNKIRKIIKIYRLFLSGMKTEQEIADELGYSLEEINNYLRDKELVKVCFPNDYDMYILALDARIKYNEKIKDHNEKKR